MRGKYSSLVPFTHRDHASRGIGSALLPALIAACENRGCRQMVAVIGDSENWPSIRLHEKFGFVRTRLLPAVGYKFGRWAISMRIGCFPRHLVCQVTLTS